MKSVLDAVLIGKAEQVEETTSGGLLYSATTSLKKAIVLSVGPDCKTAKAGDSILFYDKGFITFRHLGETIIRICEKDILAVL